MDHLYASDTSFLVTNPGAEIPDGVHSSLSYTLVRSPTWLSPPLRPHIPPTVSALLVSIAGVIIDIDPDVIAIQEGPANITRMRYFVEVFLSSTYDTFGGMNDGDQQIYILTRRGGPLLNAKVYDEADEYLRQSWKFDVAGNLKLEDYNFLRRPLIVCAEMDVPTSLLKTSCEYYNVHDEEQLLQIRRPAPMLQADSPQSEPTTERKNIYFCAIHGKSKFVSGGRRLWQSGKADERLEFIEKAVRNRRRLVAECMQLRRCLDRFVMQKEAFPLLAISGDLNDGPGMHKACAKETLADWGNTLTHPHALVHRHGLFRAVLSACGQRGCPVRVTVLAPAAVPRPHDLLTLHRPFLAVDHRV
jgi:hypothetical protein